MLEPCASIEHSLAEIELGDEAIGESDTGVMKKKSSMVRPDLVCPASQTAPPDPFIQKPHYSSLKEGLEKLNDDQLERLVSVIGKDMRFKQELYDRLRTQEKVVENIQQEENSKLAMNADKCGDCGGILFAGWFRRRSANYTNCSKLCGRRLCGQCAKSLNEQLLCRQCLQIENLNYKQREWRILLWPLTSESFGWAKFSRLCKVLPASWTVRAKLELHVVHQLESSQKGCALDSAFIDFNVTDLILEASRQKMVVALMDFTNSGHFAHIDHAIEDVKQILQRRSNCIQACARKMNNHSYEEWNYFHLLSKAIISMLLESIFPSFSFQDPQRRRPLIQRRKPKYGLFSSFSEIDLSSSSHERSIINGNPHNYRLWPPGTLRNSRTSIHVNCIEDAHDFSDGASKYSVNSSSNSLSQPKSASPNNGGLVWRWKRVSQCRIDEEIPEGEMNTRKAPLKAASENDDNPVPSKSENGIREEDKGFISIAMEQKTVEAMAGQVVTIRCVINVDERKRVCLQRPLKLIWYNRRRQIPTISKTGRIRITTVGGDAENSIPSISMVEIFDCDSFKDSGDIVCVAVGDCVVGSVQAATARLVIHEDDIAGEEPFFTDSLSLCGTSDNSYSLQQKTVSEGEPLFIKCRVTGHPQPYVKFFISGSDKRLIPIDAFDKNYKISNNNDMWTLQVNKLKLSTNTTLPMTLVYVAIAMNRIGKARSGLQLRVLNKMKAEEIL